MKQYVRLAIAALALPVLMLVGCEQKFRYPCQDPDKWNSASCQKPLCEVNRDCPENIFGPNFEQMKGEQK
jgi:hypothetical protein